MARLTTPKRLALAIALSSPLSFGLTGQIHAQEKAGNRSLVGKATEVLARFTLPEDSAAESDIVRKLQEAAIKKGSAEWGYWGTDPQKFSTWTNHSNRLIPVYTFGGTLDSVKGAKSGYRDESKLKEIYGTVPEGSLNPEAEYFDQTDIYRLQKAAIAAGKKQVIVFVFDGMDWQTTLAASTVVNGRVAYDSGRGTGLGFQDYRGTTTDFGFCVTSAFRDKAKDDVNTQTVNDPESPCEGGYDYRLGGKTPWDKAPSRDYLIGLDRALPHTVTDSASSATSLFSGIKTYNAGINVAPDGSQVEPIARELQREGFKIGVVTSVPVSHATPASAYSNNVSRNDYQDLTRDLIGLPSASHPSSPLTGVDVLLGCGWGETRDRDAAQGRNYTPGNRYLPDEDIAKVDTVNGGPYVVAQRTPGTPGSEVLKNATQAAIDGNHRLLGFFGVKGGHLPFRTADGNFDPTVDVQTREVLSPEDISENPSLADMAEAALSVLEKNEKGFWLMIEPGDVDWANHANNIDNSIGAVLSGDDAFKRVVQWVENRNAWDNTLLIVTADHGHYLQLLNPEALVTPIAPAAGEAQGE